MKTAIAAMLCAVCASAADGVKPAVEIDLKMPLGQLRFAPVSLGAERASLLVYGIDEHVDPFHEMFFYPKGTLQFAVVAHSGRVIWTKDLGRGIVPGMWFCPVFPFDLDGDGVDEIWFVNNIDPDHPLSVNSMRLERLDAKTGKSTGQWQWPKPTVQTPSHTYRNFLFGGYVRGKPVLVSAQGTYGEMRLQGWNPDMSRRWEYNIPAGPGPRGSHMCAVADMNGDGIDEVMWGERIIELDRGTQQACGDCSKYDGHSDVAQPFVDRATGRWFLYTCRESDPKRSPRVVTYDRSGERVWGDLDKGHIDMGWIAQAPPNGKPVAYALRIGTKKAGPDGTMRSGIEEFLYDALTGKPISKHTTLYKSIPVDWDGDGMHEIVRESEKQTEVVEIVTGRVLAVLQGEIAVASKLLDRPGEHVVTSSRDGIVRIYANPTAKDNDAARKRYENPMYRTNQRLATTGYNRVNLGGL